MATDQNFIPSDLRPLNLTRMVADEPRNAAARNLESGFLNSVRDGGGPSSRSIFYPATVSSDAGLGFGKPGFAWYSPPLMPIGSSYVSSNGFNEVSNLGNRVGSNVDEQGIHEGVDESSLKKVKFLCSFRGNILPRPSDGMLRYVGGHTRIVSVKREISYHEFVQKIMDTYGQPLIIKYQLPDEDLDALVSVSCSEDLENMMEEYEKFIASSSDGSSKLRLFLFSASEFEYAGLVNYGDLRDNGQRYVDAVNGIPDVRLTRRESTTSATSTQNSDNILSGGEAIDSFGSSQGDGGGLPCTMYVEGSLSMPESIPTVVQQQQPLGYDLHQPSGTYVQAYAGPNQEAVNGVDHHNPQISSPIGYPSTQALGITGPFYTHIDHLQNIQDSFLPHQFIPAAHMAMTSSAPHVRMNPNVALRFMHPHQTSVDPHLDDNLYQARIIHLPSDQFEKAYQTHLPTPQVPVQLHEGSYNWRQVPYQDHVILSDGWNPHQRGMIPENFTRLEDCYMCQRALPHAHSDTLVQDHRDSTTRSISDLNPVFYSLCSEDNLRVRPSNEAVVSGDRDHDAVASQLGVCGLTQNPEVQYNNGNILLQKPQIPDHPKVLFPSGMMGVLSDVQPPNDVFLSNIPQSQQEAQFIKQPVGTNILPVGIIPSQTLKPLVHESSKEGISNSCISCDHLGPVEGRLEAICISPPKISGINEQSTSAVNKLKKEEIPDFVPHIAGKEMLLTNAFPNPGIISDGDCIKPIESLPSSSVESVYLHDVQSVGSRQVMQPAILGISGPNPYLDTEIQHTIYDESWNGKVEASWFQSRMVFNTDAALAPSSGNSPCSLYLSNESVGDDRDPVPANSFFSNQDPWTLRHETRFPPPRPNKVPMSKQAFDTRDEGVFHHPSSNLNKDSSSEPVRCVKDSAEELIKLELQAVVEDVVASVLQLSIPSEINEPILEANQDREVYDDLEAQSRAKVEDIETKFIDNRNPSLPISDDIGRLQIIKNSDLEELQELGSGTFGTVYHGKWRGTDVAIKRINDRCFVGKPSEQDRMRNDFWNEAIKLADLHHPNVVAFYGVVLDGPGGSVATVTEYMVNGSLRQALQRNDRTLDKRKRLMIAMDVAFGMEYLHGKNIVHFDLKSDNLLVNLRDPHRPICKVGDLGLSKVKCQTLISGGVRGTLPWIAPELLNGSSSLVSEKVDVFSFGIVMWELLTGEEPYADLHYGAIIGGIVSNTLRPPVPELCDPEWKSLMQRCWSSEPSERQNFTEIASQLRSMTASLPPKGHHPSSNIAVEGTKR